MKKQLLIFLGGITLSLFAGAAEQKVFPVWECKPDRAAAPTYLASVDINIYEVPRLFHGEPIGGTIKMLYADYVVDYPWKGNRNAASPYLKEREPGDPRGTVTYLTTGFHLDIFTRELGPAGYPGKLTAEILGQYGYEKKSLDNVALRCVYGFPPAPARAK